ncbi:MerR family transcriptional regulator [Dactylosporangium sp. CS-033363]|uniref:MerR family transcriptional regulator n=1 Tax=Dactylosporangium sp. CS-033363 TaxID=3239935 RepID=UPI003D934431
MTAESPRYTVEELAAKVGMSPRNIRAHQTRNLLGAPVRRGRTAYYDDSHVRRLEAIKSLQRQGYNLVAIEAILGVRTPEPAGDGLHTLLQRIGREQPVLVQALARHGVLAHAEDGSVQMVRARLMRTVVELNRAGVHTVPSLQVLAEVLDRLRIVAEDLVRTTGQRLVDGSPTLRAEATATWDNLEGTADALATGMIHLLAEAFRTVLENLAASPVATVDNG